MNYLISEAVKKEKPIVRVLNINIHNYKFDELLQELKEGVVFTPNIDHLAKLQMDRSFFNIYGKADYCVCDSRLLILNSRLGLIPKLKEQIAGSDLLPAFCQYHKDNKDIRVFLLGGNTPHTLKNAIFNINRKANREIVVGGYSPPFGFENNPEESFKIINLINKSNATVLAVGVGAPKQEKWIMEHKSLLPEIKISMAIGATIEFEAGSIKRSPKWTTTIGMEWAYRIYREPKRLWKRYLIEDIPIFMLLIKQRLGIYKNPWI